MSLLEKAIQIAVQAHAGQKDKQGAPYITHPLRLMNKVTGEAAQIVAVLHDVVEDTATTERDLHDAGFSQEVLAALRLVTHDKSEAYEDYVVRCAANPIARQVKLADLEDNSRLDRVMLRPQHLDRDLARIARYLLSYRFLTGSLTEAEYRAAMATHGQLP